MVFFISMEAMTWFRTKSGIEKLSRSFVLTIELRRSLCHLLGDLFVSDQLTRKRQYFETSGLSGDLVAQQEFESFDLNSLSLCRDVHWHLGIYDAVS